MCGLTEMLGRKPTVSSAGCQYHWCGVKGFNSVSAVAALSSWKQKLLMDRRHELESRSAPLPSAGLGRRGAEAASALLNPVVETELLKLLNVDFECLNFDILDLTCCKNEPKTEQNMSSVYIRRGTQPVQVPLQLQT